MPGNNCREKVTAGDVAVGSAARTAAGITGSDDVGGGVGVGVGAGVGKETGGELDEVPPPPPQLDNIANIGSAIPCIRRILAFRLPPFVVI